MADTSSGWGTGTWCLMPSTRRFGKAARYSMPRFLLACGVDEDGRRDVLGCSVSLSEAEVHWRGFLSSLKDRGLHGLQLVVSDAQISDRLS